MILYVNFEVSDLERSAEFYDTFLAEFKAKRFVDRPGKFIAWARSVNDTALSISPKITDGQVERGRVAFELESREDVDRIFAKGLELGATVDTPIRLNDRDSYGGVLCDQDGHRMRLLCITA